MIRDCNLECLSLLSGNNFSQGWCLQYKREEYLIYVERGAVAGENCRYEVQTYPP